MIKIITFYHLHENTWYKYCLHWQFATIKIRQILYIPISNYVYDYLLFYHNEDEYNK